MEQDEPLHDLDGFKRYYGQHPAGVYRHLPDGRRAEQSAESRKVRGVRERGR